VSVAFLLIDLATTPFENISEITSIDFVGRNVESHKDLLVGDDCKREKPRFLRNKRVAGGKYVAPFGIPALERNQS